MIKRICFLVIILQLLTLHLYAQDYNALRKISRGVVNTSLGWTEIVRQMIEVNEEEGEVAGFFWGSLKGLVYALGRTLTGVYEVATFLLPPYSSLVEPEFIFSK